ncbi:putative transcription factor, MBF1 like protein [Bernardetia litoralis DSM 6794]|uniref:Putative transcription factor, MBF1 like protein n=1 Tax=Bernardetia litoralis (strain ATCC 23117 / DSM 6794 / NBRC 15988 / NCIMB 1366 / Fx l1 / Sio-4) TaxID=880071 RepID=I4AH57_BERLS|nr:helix-turn-helix transcriptional regulator [Bernardetia litoralis]AFM03292.1 putative transcription factor, MBF1 like protein [Bernardetia litoralis DSM 6794]
MINKELQAKLDTLTADKKSSWKEEAKYRQANREWLRHSRKIAIKINRHLKDNGMQKQELATLLNVSPQQVSKIVKGRENLTLQTISKIEKTLGISLLGLDSNREKQTKVIFKKTEFAYVQPIQEADFYQKKSAKIVEILSINNQSITEMYN